jgi:hypothetical protein
LDLFGIDEEVLELLSTTKSHPQLKRRTDLKKTMKSSKKDLAKTCTAR